MAEQHCQQQQFERLVCGALILCGLDSDKRKDVWHPVERTPKAQECEHQQRQK
jgi:hypothetical protein